MYRRLPGGAATDERKRGPGTHFVVMNPGQFQIDAGSPFHATSSFYNVLLTADYPDQQQLELIGCICN
jgi:hypothetical protein